MTLDTEFSGGERDIPEDAAGETRIRGVVSPYDWGDFHNVIKISILAPDGTSYVIQPGGVARMLFKHLDRRVEVVGQVRREKESFCIQVRQFTLCNGPE